MVALAQPGTLDSTFAENGKFMLSEHFNYETTQDIALTEEGKILVMVNSLYLVRLLEDGSWDTTFGNQGVLKVLDQVGGTSIAIDDSNRILILAFNGFYGIHSMNLYRFLQDGTPDNSFGENGVTYLGVRNADNSLIIQSDGKIVVAGSDGNQSFVQRIKDNGSSDHSFGGSGIVLLNDLPNSFALSLTQQLDGKLIITGTSDSDLFVIRLIEDGNTDSSFGSNGTTLIDEGGDEAGQDIAVMPDGKIAITA